MNDTAKIIGKMKGHVNHKLHIWIERPFTNFIIDYFKNFNGGIIGLEAGCWKGENAALMFKYLKNLKFLHMVDPHLYNIEKDYQDVSQEMHQNLKPYERKYKYHRCKAEDFKHPKNSLDFTYLDADHEYESTRNQLKNLFPMVKKGGIFGGHDFNSKYYGEVKAIVEFANEHDLDITGEKYCWWAIK
jgi:hypothetical protein